MSGHLRTLTIINEIIRDELFPLIGLPRETFGNRISDIPNNLREIRDTIQNILEQSNDQSQKLDDVITRTTNIRTDIKEKIPPETLEGISKLFEE